jgi:2-hydroxychromene-2-carboxylate isomerase
MSLQPQRCLVYVKNAHPEKYEALFNSCFEALWLDQKDISKPDNLRSAIATTFDEQQTEEIIRAADSPGVKAALMENTTHAFKDLGAFGCPWFWVHDGKGNAEPFFGSDRFHYMWDYLELPHQDLALVERSLEKL